MTINLLKYSIIYYFFSNLSKKNPLKRLHICPIYLSRSDLLKEQLVFFVSSTFVTTIFYKHKKDFHVCRTTKQEFSRKEWCLVIMVRSIRSSFWMEENFPQSIRKRTKNSSWNGLYSIVARDAHSYWIVANTFFMKKVSFKLKKHRIFNFAFFFIFNFS